MELINRCKLIKISINCCKDIVLIFKNSEMGTKVDLYGRISIYILYKVINNKMKIYDILRGFRFKYLCSLTIVRIIRGMFDGRQSCCEIV